MSGPSDFLSPHPKMMQCSTNWRLTGRGTFCACRGRTTRGLRCCEGCRLTPLRFSDHSNCRLVGPGSPLKTSCSPTESTLTRPAIAPFLGLSSQFPPSLNHSRASTVSPETAVVVDLAVSWFLDLILLNGPGPPSGLDEGRQAAKAPLVPGTANCNARNESAGG